ncbi:unnamed protein product [Schistosoma mattheei]|uniref:Uncharacterized protein n=1 Tax=Schistosoma mattheei TaxID=31246 RepID=A0A183NIL7_9TREM|nr:unnamed protein product [Schistosoma mattheei]
MPEHRLPRHAILASVGNGWKKVRGGQIKTWHHEERIRNGAKKLLKARNTTTQGRIDNFFSCVPSKSNSSTSTPNSNHKKVSNSASDRKRKSNADIPIAVTPPIIEEVSMAIRQIKSGKAAGPENISAEVLNSDIEATVKMLHVLFRDLGVRTIAGRPERIPHQDTKERSEQM